MADGAGPRPSSAEARAGDAASDGAAARARLSGAYATYDDESHRARWADDQPGNRAMVDERDRLAHRLVAAAWPGRPGTPAPVVLDLGCGDGEHLVRFLAAAPPGSPLADARPVGLDLLPTRLGAARERWGARVLRADGAALPLAGGSVDLVLALTVLSSVLEPDHQRAVAAEIVRVLAPGGLALVYDLRVPSPRNRQVTPVPRRRLAELFPGLVSTSRTLTLLPPVARRLGARTPVAYPVLARLPLLRTHRLTVVARPG